MTYLGERDPDKCSAIDFDRIFELEKAEKSFREDLETLLGKYNMEKGSNTDNYILAEYLRDCIKAFDCAIVLRDRYQTLPDSDSFEIKGDRIVNKEIRYFIIGNDLIGNLIHDQKLKVVFNIEINIDDDVVDSIKKWFSENPTYKFEEYKIKLIKNLKKLS